MALVAITVSLMLSGPSPTKSADDVLPPSVRRGPGSGGDGFPCYANCDASTIQPCLNVNDFMCFLNKFSTGSPYANCDNSSIVPVLNVNDFACFLNSYAAGCANPCGSP